MFLPDDRFGRRGFFALFEPVFQDGSAFANQVITDMESSENFGIACALPVHRKRLRSQGEQFVGEVDFGNTVKRSERFHLAAIHAARCGIHFRIGAVGVPAENFIDPAGFLQQFPPVQGRYQPQAGNAVAKRNGIDGPRHMLPLNNLRSRNTRTRMKLIQGDQNPGMVLARAPQTVQQVVQKSVIRFFARLHAVLVGL